MITSVQKNTGNNIFSLHRPYFDLGPVTDAPLSSRVPLLDYEGLDHEVVYRLQRHYTERFRFSLIAESGLSQYARTSPSEVQEAYRTPQWQRLCDLVDEFPGLPSKMQVSILYLLRSLGFHRLILKLVPANANALIKDDDTAMKAAIRASIHYRLYNDISTCISSLEDVIHQRPVFSLARHTAAIVLLILAAKVCRDVQAIRRYRSFAQSYIDAPQHDQSSFLYHMLKSRFFRAASFEPFLAGDRRRLIEEMNLAEELGRTAPVRTETEHFIAQENLCSLLESRTREAITLGDLELAKSRVEENVQINPWDAKTRIELGEIHFRCGEIKKAAQEYSLAAQLSPPGGSVSRYMAGYCYEYLGDIEQAIQFYQASLQIDSDGISPVQGLLRTTKLTEQKALHRWAEEKAEQLVKAGHMIHEELVLPNTGVWDKNNQKINLSLLCIKVNHP